MFLFVWDDLPSLQVCSEFQRVLDHFTVAHLSVSQVFRLLLLFLSSFSNSVDRILPSFTLSFRARHSVRQSGWSVFVLGSQMLDEPIVFRNLAHLWETVVHQFFCWVSILSHSATALSCFTREPWTPALLTSQPFPLSVDQFPPCVFLISSIWSFPAPLSLHSSPLSFHLFYLSHVSSLNFQIEDFLPIHPRPDTGSRKIAEAHWTFCI